MEFTSVNSVEKISDPVSSQGVMEDSGNTLQIETMHYCESHERLRMRSRQTEERKSPISHARVFKRISHSMIMLTFKTRS